jgi:hypothetical protein
VFGRSERPRGGLLCRLGLATFAQACPIDGCYGGRMNRREARRLAGALRDELWSRSSEGLRAPVPSGLP